MIQNERKRKYIIIRFGLKMIHNNEAEDSNFRLDVLLFYFNMFIFLIFSIVT